MDRTPITINIVDASFLPQVMEVMDAAFDPIYGEAWNAAQCLGVIKGPGAWMLLAEQNARPVGFALCRAVLDEAELLLIAVKVEARRSGVGSRLLRAVIESARVRGIARLFLEVRANNPAVALYTTHDFLRVGSRRDYYRGANGDVFDAHSYSLAL